jgi:hypothetical protein
MTDTTDPADQLAVQLAALRERHLYDGDDEPAVICNVDGYPSTLTCLCTHGHTRHLGTDEIRCMSYVGQPDCDCTRFVPDAASVSTLWLAYTTILRALDIDQLVQLVPTVHASQHVRDWPVDEQAVWDAHDGDHEAALRAVDIYRRRKVAVQLVQTLVGAA